jgi:hypothetical protein
MKTHGAPIEDLCQQARVMAQAAVDTGDDLTYMTARLTQDNDCTAAAYRLRP